MEKSTDKLKRDKVSVDPATFSTLDFAIFPHFGTLGLSAGGKIQKRWISSSSFIAVAVAVAAAAAGGVGGVGVVVVVVVAVAVAVAAVVGRFSQAHRFRCFVPR